MGTVVIHAGMGKAGSSSIQKSLAINAERLRERDIRILVPRPREDSGADDRIRLEEYGSGSVVAQDILDRYLAEGKSAVLEPVFEQLDQAANRFPTIVLSAEAFELLFWRADEDFLEALDGLALRHQVRVAYYVRPQHTAFEAHWRQWGFRGGWAPSEFLAFRVPALHYHQTYVSVNQIASRVSFEPRPFRADLLAHGDPGRDFSRHFLGVEDGSEADEAVWANPGLPLQVVNALRGAPEGLLWESMHDNAKLNRIKTLLDGIDVEETEATIRSRHVLQAHCHEVFEPGNQRLIETLGWPTESFVPPVGELGPSREALPGLLDALWQPQASKTELSMLYAALDAAVSDRGRRGSREESRLLAGDDRRPPRSSVRRRLARRVRNWARVGG